MGRRMRLGGNRESAIYDEDLTVGGKTAITPYMSAGQIAFVAGASPTITDTLSGFVTAGIKANDVYQIKGSTNNNDFFHVINVTAGTLTLAAMHELTNETAGAGTVTIYPVQDQGIVAGSGLLSSIFHDRQHAIDSSDDHTSTITQNNLMDADANGLPDDSGLSVTDVSDAVSKKHTQNADTDLDATFEASLKNCDNHTSGSTNFVLVKQAAEADLSQTISDPPTQSEVQAISDKVDAILAVLRSANVLST